MLDLRNYHDGVHVFGCVDYMPYSFYLCIHVCA